MAENLTFNLDVNSAQAVDSINTFFSTFEKGAEQAKSKLNTAFNQKIQTDIKVEFKNGALVAKEVQSLKQESSRLAQVYKAVNGELGKTPNQLKKQQAVLKSLLGDTQKFKDGTKKVTAEWTTLTAKIKQVDNELEKMGGGGGLAKLTNRFIGIQTAANLATAGIMNVVRSIGDLVQTAFRMETLSLQMEAFVGSAAGAEAAFDRFVEIAANSPLNLEQVAGAGKIMMAFGMTTEEAIKATEQLSLVSAATGADINLLSRNMGQIVAQGRAYTRDLTQFAIQGIPIWEQLSVATGKNVTELKDMATKGRITGTEVGAALDLMTAKGTDFAEIGERMQETFAGRFAAIQAAAQDMSKEFIDAFNNIDKALGGPVSNSMKAFADSLKEVAKNFGTIGSVALAAGIGVGTFFAVMAVGNIVSIVQSLGGIVATFGIMKASILASLASQLALMGAMGPVAWASAAAGIAAAGIAFVAIKGQIDGVTEEQKELTGEIANTEGATGELTDSAKKYAEQTGNGDTVDAYNDQQKAVTGINEELTRAIEILKEQQKAKNELFEDDQERIKGLMDLEKDKIDAAKDARDEAKSAIDAKYEAEKSHLDETLSLIRQKYDEEIGALREKTPAEKALYDLEKRKLQAKIEAGGLDAEEALRLQARLERMNANEKIQGLVVQQKKEEEKVTKSLAELEEDRKVNLGEIEKTFERTSGAAEQQQAKLQEDLKKSEAAQNQFNKEIDASVDSTDKLKSSVETTTQAVNTQVARVASLASQYANAAREAENLAAQIRKANAAKANNSGGSGGNTPTTSNFAGGPIGAGTTSWVNELGKEAFLSASGKLSMINDRGGKWTAPTDGTIIPAHLTKKLNVPNGGVNINNTSNASASAGAAGGMSMSRMVNAIAGALGGDTVTNNVTIQSSNTTQAASEVMVQLAKLKRLRYN